MRAGAKSVRADRDAGEVPRRLEIGIAALGQDAVEVLGSAAHAACVGLALPAIAVPAVEASCGAVAGDEVVGVLNVQFVRRDAARRGHVRADNGGVGIDVAAGVDGAGHF